MATILTIIPYHFYPPVSGGALRCFYILKEMARQHTIYVLTNQPVEDFVSHGKLCLPTNVHIVSTAKLPKFHSFLSGIFPAKVADAINYKILKRSLFGSTNLYLLKTYTGLVNLIDKVNFDLVVYENLESLGEVNHIIKRMNPNCLHLYDAHNVDSELWAQQAISNQNENFKSYAATALSLEQKLYKKVDAYFCCSEDDNVLLTKLNHNKIKGTVIPNGVDVTSRPYDNNPSKYKKAELLFCGSLDYYPNKEGLLWFYDEVFPILKSALPQIRLTVIGNVSNTDDYAKLIADSSINFIGKVESVVSHYKASSVSIVPLLSGSGTRLKVLEALSMGNPVVSTKIGAEGIRYEAGKDLLVANYPHDFAASILLLLNDKTTYEAIKVSGYTLAKSIYDWSVIGQKINHHLEVLLNE